LRERERRQSARGTHARPFVNRLGGWLLGRSFARIFAELQEAQWLPGDELQRRNAVRLSRLLRHAAENVPFYRELYRRRGLSPTALSTTEELGALPVMTKTVYRGGGTGEFVAENVPAFRRQERATSGSTGQPLAFAIDRQAGPVIFASHLFYDSWFDLGPFDRYIRIMSPPAATSGLPPETPAGFRLRQTISARLQRLYEARTQQRISVWEVDEARADDIWRRLEAFRPAYVMGYTSTLAELADVLTRRRRRLTRSLRAVVTIGETLSPSRKRAIERYFAAPIVNRYGLREFGSWSAQSCAVSADRFHVNTELVVCEIVRDDGSLAEPKEVGRVVLTDLFNYARPFIRYDTGDLGAIDPEPCPCGRTFPLLGPIEGRSTECVRTPSGKMIAPIVLGHYLFVYSRNLDAVRHYQLIQTGPRDARLLIVPGAGWNAATAQRLQSDLAGLLGEDIQATVESVSEIPLERSGKRPIIKVLLEAKLPPLRLVP
jgi:phenylacetate-CoA ligase